MKYENENENKDKDISNRDNLNQITFSDSDTLWKVQGISSSLKDWLKSTYYIIIDIFFEILEDLEYWISEFGIPVWEYYLFLYFI